MSIEFREPANELALNMMAEMFRETLVACDGKVALVNETHFETGEMSNLARAAGQPVDLVIHEEGDIKTLSDGTRYECTHQGWKRLD